MYIVRYFNALLPIQGSHGSELKVSKNKNSLRLSKKAGNFYLAQKSGKSQEIWKQESEYFKICNKTSGNSDTFICSSFENMTIMFILRA